VLMLVEDTTELEVVYLGWLEFVIVVAVAVAAVVVVNHHQHLTVVVAAGVEARELHV